MYAQNVIAGLKCPPEIFPPSPIAIAREPRMSAGFPVNANEQQCSEKLNGYLVHGLHILYQKM
jgi:hypothetical protein